MSAPGRAASLADLSVVIPVGYGEEAWPNILGDLAALPDDAEIVLAGVAPPALPLPPRCRWLIAAPGRPSQMNAGARATSRPFLWFLHADSRLTPGALPALERALLASPDALHYFDLAFLSDGPAWMRVNEAGTWLRSHWGGMPFGDQGLCLSRVAWDRLGGFRTDAAYGEDHLLVWKARQTGTALRPVGATLLTSARRYQERGWLRTTLRHLRLTAKQALPEWIRLVRR